MKTLVVTNRKGGVGKTTQSRTLCEYFSVKRKLRVLAIDLDSQCSLSHLLLDMDISMIGERGVRPPIHPIYNPEDPEQADWDGRSSSADIFYGKAVDPYVAQYPDGAETLDVLPANKELLSEVEEQDRPVLQKQVIERLREFLNLESVQEAYDLAIVDTGPGASPLSQAALRASTHVLIPIEVEPQCVRGLYEMMSEIRQENTRRTLETRVELVGIQPNRVKIRRALHKGLLRKVQTEFKGKVSPVVLPDLVGFAERDADLAAPRSFLNLPPSDKARRAAIEFCEFVEGKIFGVVT